MAHYEFSLDKFHINNTRAVHNDTDIVTFAVNIDGQMSTPQVKRMGDVNNGDHIVGLSIDPLDIEPSSQVKFTYVIVNSGYDASNEGTVKTVTNLLSQVAGAITDTYLPGLGTFGNWVTQQLHDIFYVNCDGVVAADLISVTGADLANWTFKGIHSETRDYPGTDSAVGCGSNSRYSVTWSVRSLDTVQTPTPKIIYAITQGGNLLWYRDNANNGTENWDARSQSIIGRGGWTNFRSVFSGCGGTFYAITQDGNLLWYRDLANDGTENWDARSQSIIGRGGWTNFHSVFAAH